MTPEREPLSTIERLTLLPVVVAAICCAIVITVWAAQSPASPPVGTAAKADAPPVAHHRPHHRLRAFPMIGRTNPLEAQPAPESASVTPQEQPPTPLPKPDQAPN
jgi:hypothetical protein